MKKRALDIFKLLEDLNSSKEDIWNSLTEEEQRGFAPLVVQRWMSGTGDKRQIMLLNEFANPCIFTLGRHPQLLMRLLHACSSKTPKRYGWLATKSKKKNVESIKVLCEYFGMSEREAAMCRPFPSNNELVEMASELGWQADDIKKLKKEAKDE